MTESLGSDYNATLMGQPNIKKDAKRQSPIRLVNNTGCTYVSTGLESSALFLSLTLLPHMFLIVMFHTMSSWALLPFAPVNTSLLCAYSSVLFRRVLLNVEQVFGACRSRNQ